MTGPLAREYLIARLKHWFVQSISRLALIVIKCNIVIVIECFVTPTTIAPLHPKLVVEPLLSLTCFILEPQKGLFLMFEPSNLVIE